MRNYKERKCQICGSDRVEPVNITNDGMTMVVCMSCGTRDKVPTLKGI